MAVKTFELTCCAEGLWTDCWSLEAQGGPVLAGSDGWSVTKSTLHGGPSDGIDLVTLNNGRLSLDVLPTRGMGIWRGICGDLRLGWNSPVRHPVHPARVNLESRDQLGWLDGFNEWICRCGLAFNGPPGVDHDGTPLTLHGRIANRSAHDVAVEIDDAEEGSLSLVGVVDETSMFGTNLRLTSRVTLPAGRPVIRIVDEVTNLASGEQEYELLYHINQGSPFLETGAEYAVPFREMAPRDPRAADGIETWQQYEGPEAGYAEQVYFFAPIADSEGWSRVLLRNRAGDAGLSVRFRTDTLPWLAVWKNTQAAEDGYVTGLEPCTDFPNLKSYEREQGRLRRLGSGETERLELEIEIATTSAEVARLAKEIAALQGDEEGTIHPTPISRFSPV